MTKRIIIEETDDNSSYRQPQVQAPTQKPMEYEMPTRGQSFSDGVTNSFWRAIAVGFAFIALFIYLVK